MDNLERNEFFFLDKKWMRSIHIDAFFDYILSKPNEYYDEPQKNPTGAEPSSSGADDLDESDLVLKLIRRASSKRQKRKYTRRNNGGGTDAGNNGGNANGGGDDDDDDEDDDDLDLDDDGAAKSEKHRGKRVKAAVTYSDRSDDELDDDEDRDAWEDDADDVMHVDNPTASSSKNAEGRKVGSIRRKSVVQFASTRENIPKLGKPKNIITHHVPTPHPSPTTMPDIKLNHNPSGGTGEAGNLRIVPSPGAAGSPGTPQLRWRSINVGGGPTQAGDMPTSQPFLPVTSAAATTSQTQKGNNNNSNNNNNNSSTSSSSSRRKQSGDASASGHFDSFRLQNKRQQKQQQQQDRQSTDSNWTWTNNNNSSNSSSNALGGGGLGSEVSKDNNNDSFSYAELLIPPTTVSSDPNVMINLLQKQLVKAVGMLEDNKRTLEDNQRKIDLLENVVRQREDEVRKRAARTLKEEVISLLNRWE